MGLHVDLEYTLEQVKRELIENNIDLTGDLLKAVIGEMMVSARDAARHTLAASIQRRKPNVLRQPYDMKSAVALGVQFLDEHDPSWHQRADPATLNMAYHGLCLLSQLYGSFAAGIEDLGLASLVGEEVRDSDGWEFGFTLPATTPAEQLGTLYVQLTEEWRIVLEDKRHSSRMPELKERRNYEQEDPLR